MVDETEAEDLVGGAEFRDAELRRARFTEVDLREARFANSYLTRAVIRGCDVGGMEIDSPWLLEGDAPFVVNGVDVRAFVEATLNERFPGRDLRTADTPGGLRAAWSALEETWAATLSRVKALPPESVESSVDGEWSFAQTLRHLVLATDVWLGKAILGTEQPFHPLGLADASAEENGLDVSVFASGTPSYDEVLEARTGRVGMVRDFLADVTSEELGVTRTNPWSPEQPETTLSCLRTILEEEWEHHRYAVRDLAAIEARPRRWITHSRELPGVEM